MIPDIESLRDHLQTAVELEHSTLPPYLCALYSIHDGANAEAAEAIRGVVVEEMLHMTLASNVLNAVGGSPAIDDPDFVPTYPGHLPHSGARFEVGLMKLCPEAVETFLAIERPEPPGAPPEDDRYHTIGQFYEAIEMALVALEGKARAEGHTIFTGDAARQVRPEHFHAPGGEVVVVRDLESALAALEEIKDQGEGLSHTIFDGDERFGEERELAHYFRFNEIYTGRRYGPEDRPGDPPSGESFPIDWDAVWNMAPNPRMSDQAERPETLAKMREFNRRYTDLLASLHRVFDGAPGTLGDAVSKMFELRSAAVELMRTPSGAGDTTAGPSFEYLAE